MYTWRFNKFKGDANAVGNELSNLGDGVTTEQVLEYAEENPESELHKCFDWDDKSAARKYRLHQARQIMCELIYEAPKESSNENTNVRVYYQLEGENKYHKTAITITQEDSYQRLLNKAMAELRAFKQKYKMLSELDEILALIN